MCRERIVGGCTRALRQLAQPGDGIRGEGLKIVPQLGTAPEEIDPVLDPFARVGERAGELRKIAQSRLKNDIAQVHRAVVSVEAADRAIVVAVGVDGDDDGAHAVCGGIDRANEKRPAARSGAGNAGVEEAQAARGARRLRIEARVDA